MNDRDVALIRVENHPLLQRIEDLRHRRVAADFSPEQSGQRGSDFDRGLLETHEVVKTFLVERILEQQQAKTCAVLESEFLITDACDHNGNGRFMMDVKPEQLQWLLEHDYVYEDTESDYVVPGGRRHFHPNPEKHNVGDVCQVVFEMECGKHGQHLQ